MDARKSTCNFHAFRYTHRFFELIDFLFSDFRGDLAGPSLPSLWAHRAHRADPLSFRPKNGVGSEDPKTAIRNRYSSIDVS